MEILIFGKETEMGIEFYYRQRMFENVLSNAARMYREKMQKYIDTNSYCCLCCSEVFSLADNHVPDEMEIWFWENNMDRIDF